MRPAIKRGLIGLVIVLVLIVAAAVAAPFFVPVDTYKRQIAKQVESATGREMVIEGEVSFSLLPRTQLAVNGVRFANAEWAEQADMVRLQSLKARVNPWSLLSGAVTIESFVLTRPQIHLAVNRDGTPNWEFAGGGASEPAEETAGDGESGGGMGLSDLTLEDVRLVDGTVIYTDMAAGTTETLTGVNLGLELATLDSPFAADGEVTWQDETLELRLKTGAPRGLMLGEATDVTLKLSSDPIRVTYNGSLTMGDPQKLDGEVELTAAPKKLARLAGSELPARGDALTYAYLSGSVSATGQRYAFTADDIELDDIQGSGSLALDLARAKPFVKGSLELGKLDVTPYMPPPAEDGGDAADDSAESGPTPWSDEPIDLAALRTLNAAFDLSAESIKARDIEIGESELTAKLRDGELTVDLTKMALYGGNGTARIALDGSGETPALAHRADLEGVNAQPLLRDAAGFDRLSGTGAITYQVRGQGRSQNALIGNLNGKGALSFTDGAIRGINLAKMVRSVKNAFTGGGGTQKTDFAELAGTFTITDGVLTNDDLLLLNPLLRVRGAGQSDLQAKTVDYRVTPKAVASTVGQGGETERSGVAVPVDITGPWHDLSYKPDMTSILKSAVKDPGKLKDSAKQTIDKLRSGGDPGALLDSLGGGSGSGESTDGGGDTTGGGNTDGASSTKDKAKDAINSLFGN